MFAKGELIVYGCEGVFVVSEYANSPIDKNDDRVFYVLKPVYGNESNIIYTPADNQRVKMRRVMSRDEALALIEDMPDIPSLQIENEKKRRIAYKEALNECENKSYIQIIKSVRQKREDCVNQRKRLSESDAEYEKKAKFCLHGELAAALDIAFDDIEEYVLNMIMAKQICTLQDNRTQ